MGVVAMVGTYASENRPHYARHLLPVWRGLPAEMRGVGDAHQWVLVASGRDAKLMARNGRNVIYVEHGAGLTYSGDSFAASVSGYAGGEGMSKVKLFLCPNEHVARRWNATYPTIPAVVVGDPSLDRWANADLSPLVDRRSVAFTFHWPSTLCPEAGTALGHYDTALPEIVAELRGRGWEVFGHEHPRWDGALADRWRTLGVEVVGYDTVMRDARVLVADNTSLQNEFVAVTGRPLVYLNCPAYRRDVHHGEPSRFWSHPQGQVQVDGPDGVVAGIEAAAVDAPEAVTARERMTVDTYTWVDGAATTRAVAAVVAVVTGS